MSPPRIIAGLHKNRRLKVPEDKSVRPTAERTREALFDILESQGGLEGLTVADLFAGTGAIGLEALSRGAAFAVFVEKERAAARLIEANIRHLKEERRARLMLADAARPPAPPMSFDLAYLDPPYGSDLAGPALLALREGGWLKPEATVVLESAVRERFLPPAAFSIEDERRYGAARLLFLRGA